MPTSTVGKLLDLGACWDDEEVLEVADGKDAWNALEVLGLDNVSAEDRLWVCANAFLMPECVGVEFSVLCAERVLPNFEEKHPSEGTLKELLEATRSGDRETAEEILKNKRDFDRFQTIHDSAHYASSSVVMAAICLLTPIYPSHQSAFYAVMSKVCKSYDSKAHGDSHKRRGITVFSPYVCDFCSNVRAEEQEWQVDKLGELIRGTQ